MAAAPLSGHVGNLSDAQTQALSDFRAAVAPAHNPDDFECLRFLRARKFTVAAAVELYQKQLKIRERLHLDDILQHPPTKILRLYAMLMPFSFHGFDKLGHPMYIQRTGAAHIDLIGSFVTREQVVLTHAYDMETMCARARAQTQKLGRQMETFVFILDLEGIGMKHFAFIKFLQAITELDQDCYPERLAKTYIINAPMIFPALWKVVKAFLDPVVAAKVEVLGSNYRQELLERIDADQLPVQYGGSCKCGGGGGGECVSLTPADVARDALIEYETDMNMREFVVGARQCTTHAVDVADASRDKPIRVGWYFRSMKNDIKFGVEFVPAAVGAPTEVISETAKRDCAAQAVTGSLQVTRAGQVRLIFDNSYSMLTSKTLKLATTLVEDAAAPDDVKEDDA